MIDGNLLIEYFDVSKKFVNNSTKIKLTLKESKKIRKDIPKRDDGMPYSGSTIEYYLHYLGDVGKDVFHERKKLFPKTQLVKWYISQFNPDDSEQLLEEVISLKKKISNRISEHYSSEAGLITKEKLKKRSSEWAPILGKKNSERWKDPEYSSLQKERRKMSGMYEKIAEKSKIRNSDPVFREKLLLANRNPERVSKISASAKKMWENARLYDPDKIRRMMISSRNKNYSFNGIMMNSIEYLVAKILEDISVSFEYEKVITFGNITYIPDFFIQECNTIIECYGDYWHANPYIFSNLDSVYRTPVEEIWKRDSRKEKLFLENGYEYYSFWENDIVNSTSTVKKQLCSILKKN